MRLVLASGSPRRRQLLEALGYQVVVLHPDVDETSHPGENAEDLVRRLCVAKARSVTPPDGLPVIAADTVVALDGALLGKPRDRPDARAMLGRLAGRTHVVWTGYCVRHASAEHCGTVRSTVLMRALTPGEIAAYVASGAGDDKAGAYGIQDTGAALVESVAGSYSNVVGLPVTEVIATLRSVVGAAV